MLANRLEEALNDYIWAQKFMRENPVIDYRQLGLRYKLYNWQVLYNAAAVHCKMGLWDKAKDILLAASQEKAGSRASNVEVALENIARKELLSPLFVPEGEVFRPRKQDIDQIQQRDFLGKPKVIVSPVPNDKQGGFDPHHEEKAEQKRDDTPETREMSMTGPYMGQTTGELTVPKGAMVLFFVDEVDRDGMATVTYDGKKGIVPMAMLEAVDRSSKAKRRRGLPPGLKPPARPESHVVDGASVSAPPDSLTPPPPYASATMLGAEPPMYFATSDGNSEQDGGWEQGEEAVVVKVHYRYTVALKVPLDTPYDELQQRIGHKLGQPAKLLRLRHRQQGSQVLKPLDGEGELQDLLKSAEAGRTTLWCQTEHPLDNRTILYQMMALYDYTGEGPEDLQFSEGDTIDILSEVNDEWLEGHCSGHIGIFPSCFASREGEPRKAE